MPIWVASMPGTFNLNPVGRKMPKPKGARKIIPSFLSGPKRPTVIPNIFCLRLFLVPMVVCVMKHFRSSAPGLSSHSCVQSPNFFLCRFLRGKGGSSSGFRFFPAAYWYLIGKFCYASTAGERRPAPMKESVKVLAIKTGREFVGSIIGPLEYGQIHRRKKSRRYWRSTFAVA